MALASHRLALPKATADDPLAAGKQVPIVCPGHSRPISELQFSPMTADGVFLVSACLDKLPMLRRGDTGDWIGTFTGHKGAVWSAKVDATATKAATAGGDFCAKLWDAITGAELREFSHKHIVKTVEFTPDGTKLLSGSSDKTCKLWDLAGGAADPLAVLEHPEGVNKVVACSDGNTAISGGKDGVLRVWDLRSATAVREVKVSPNVVMDLELSRDGAILTASSGKTVTFFDARGDYSVLKAHVMPDAEGRGFPNFLEEGGASLAPDGKRFVAGGGDLWVRVFDFETGAQLECHKGHHGPIRCLRYSPTGESYASGSEDGTIRIWQSDVSGAAPPAPPAAGGSSGSS